MRIPKNPLFSYKNTEVYLFVYHKEWGIFKNLLANLGIAQKSPKDEKNS